MHLDVAAVISPAGSRLGSGPIAAATHPDITAVIGLDSDRIAAGFRQEFDRSPTLTSGDGGGAPDVRAGARARDTVHSHL